jgi:NAD(P)-dependent dehydrogenase (short-subunit alcohol dehydrogenase family)
MYAFFGAPHAPAYAASKGGVVQLTQSLAVAWAKDGIRSTPSRRADCHADVRECLRDEARSRAIVERRPLGRWGNADDVPPPALAARRRARHRVVLPVDGGYSVT